MKVAIYARVSDRKKKADGERRQDVNRQVEIIKAHLTRKGVKEFKVYTDDGKSAYTEDLNSRPAFKQLMNDCLRHYIKEIYIEDMTRFSRNLALGIKWLTKLGKLNVELISLKEGQLEYTSAEGWMKSNFLLLFSEWSSRISADKVKSGMKKAKLKGKHIGRPRKPKGAKINPTLSSKKSTKLNTEVR